MDTLHLHQLTFKGINIQMISRQDSSTSGPPYGNGNSKMLHAGHVHDSGYDKTRIQRMYQYPACMKEALMHKKANQFGYNSKTLSNNVPAPLCPCCELPINTVRIDMNYGTTPSPDNFKPGNEIFKLNAGSAMFFTFIKMTIVYLIVRFLLSDCYNLITNTVSSNCSQAENIPRCHRNVVAKYSSYNKAISDDEPFLYVVDILNLVTIVISIAFFLYYRRYQYEVYKLVDFSNTSQSDYTIFVQDIPIFLSTGPKNKNLQCEYESQLKKAFEAEIREWIDFVKYTKGVNQNLDASLYKLLQADPNIASGPLVTSVTLCFDLTEMEKLNTMRTQLMQEHNHNVSKDIDQDQNSLSFIPNQIEVINHEYIQLSKKFAVDNTAAFNLSHFVGKAFVSFQYEHFKQYMLEYFRVEDQIMVAQHALKLGSAAEPSDVYWFNMKIGKGTRRNSIIISYMIMLMCLFFSFASIFGIQFYQFSNTPADPASQTKQQVVVGYIFTISMTTLTVIINFILAAICQKLTVWEKHKTKTDYIVSLMIKSILSQFLNTALIYYLVSVVATLTIPQKTSPLNDNGIVAQVTSLIAVSGFIQIVMNALQVGTLFSWLLNKCKYGKLEDVNMFQVELNNQLQDPQFDFSDRYAYYIVNVYVISFFSYITPYISIILALIFLVQYWVDKYNLFKRFSCPTDFNFRLSRMTLKAFEFSVFVFALGNYIFSFTIHPTKDESEYHVINLIALLLALAYCIAIVLLPKKWFERINVESYETASYSQCLQNESFNKVYWLSNPATSFAQEPDLNNSKKFVNYGQVDQLANSADFDQIVEAELKGNNKVETYDKEQIKMVADLVEGIQEQIGGIFANDEGDIDILGKIQEAAKK